MSNGKRIDENGSTYDAANPYKDRDPRLAQTIFYQGMMWGRADKEERRAIDVRYNSDADKGVDYTSAMGGTYTGYYLKKFVNNISCKEPATYPHAWMIFRYGEILLNAAEAYNEAEGRHTVISMRYAPVPVCRPMQICRKVNSANVSATKDASNWLSKIIVSSMYAAGNYMTMLLLREKPESPVTTSC